MIKKRIISFLMLLSLIVTFIPSNTVSAAKVPKFKMGGYTVTTKDTVRESKRVKMSIEKNIYVPDTILKDIENIMSVIEKETKLSFYPKGNKAKVTVEVKRFGSKPGTELGSAFGEYSGVTVSPGDLLVRSGESYALVHELLHCIYYRNSNSVRLSTFMMEGFSTYFSMKIIDEKRLVFCTSNIHTNMHGMAIEPDGKNVEDLLKKVDEWENYKLGYRFYYYLHTQVSKTAYKNIMKKSGNGYKNGTQLDVNDTIRFVKALYGKDIFTKFGAWYEKEKDNIDIVNYVMDYTQYKTIERYPTLGSFAFFNDINCIYKDSIVFDFRKGFEYLQSYIKKQPAGIYGTLNMQGQAMVEFCDDKGQCIKKFENANGTMDVSVPGASIIRITGDGQNINITFDYDKMVK